ncbi:MAG: diguanylate cyclase [Candidatus Electrothrix sp. GW3-4]|uniref:diguanylate cyclase n=1 Tax=Candidatus Electrothrix sp. GW3-4 TaxID=3126740 RepID=UPI0030CB42E7
MKPEYLDGGTGIANRRQFDRHLNRAWRSAQKTGNPLSLLFCDIDQFTSFHTHYGRPASEACLRQVAECLQATLRRPTDLAARYEEKKFAILLPYTDAHGALIIADRVLADVRALAIPHEKSNVAPVVTVSIGGHSLWPVSRLPIRTIIQLAEIRLFQAKHCGKNQSRLSTACRDTLEE